LSVLILARLRRLYFEANKNQWSLIRGIDEEIGIFFIAQIKLDHDEQMQHYKSGSKLVIVPHLSKINSPKTATNYRW
jgi:hypothetical protein